MNFITYSQLVKDVIDWSYSLPRDIDAFIGLPRSGIIPASILALHRNARLGTVDEYAQGRLMLGGYRDQRTKIQKVMVVDDSILSGKSLSRAASKLLENDVKIIYGGIYLDPRNKEQWLYYKHLTLPRIFEWNWLHHYWLQRSCMDIDGVLCRDPTKAENDDGPRYRQFLNTAEPRHLPLVEVNTLVTSRLECYRHQTKCWLQKNNILYKNLIMHPATSAVERRKLGDHAKRKAKVYNESKYQLFIESSERQAKQINKLTKKPVLCTDTMTMFA